MASFKPLASFIIGASLFASGASAQTWAANHPRRAEVNGRLANQNSRIRQGLADGQLNRRQVNELHRDDRAIRGEERTYAASHDGHISSRAQTYFNRQENGNSQAIWAERH